MGGDAKAESATSGNKRHVSFVGWARNITEPSSLVRTGGGGGDQEWRRALRRGELQVDGGDSDVVAADLPKELTFLEIETALPKISPLPPGGGGVGYDSLPRWL